MVDVSCGSGEETTVESSAGGGERSLMVEWVEGETAREIYCSGGNGEQSVVVVMGGGEGVGGGKPR